MSGSPNLPSSNGLGQDVPEVYKDLYKTAVDKLTSPLDESLLRLVIIWQSLSPETRRMVLALVRADRPDWNL